MCRADGACGQRPSVLQRSLLCFLTLLLAGPSWLRGGGRKGVFFFHRGRTLSRRSWWQGQISLLQNTQTSFGAHPTSLRTRAPLLGGKVASGPKNDRWFLSNVHYSRVYIFCIVIPLRLLINICFLLSEQTHHSEHCVYICYNMFRPSPGRCYNDMSATYNEIEAASVYFLFISL